MSVQRMADRYATAADLADDLRHWLRTGEDETALHAATGSTIDLSSAAEQDLVCTGPAVRRFASRLTGPDPAQGPARV